METDLFHQVARQLSPLCKQLVELVAASDVVLADETPLKMRHERRQVALALVPHPWVAWAAEMQLSFSSGSEAYSCLTGKHF